MNSWQRIYHQVNFPVDYLFLKFGQKIKNHVQSGRIRKQDRRTDTRSKDAPQVEFSHISLKSLNFEKIDIDVAGSISGLF